GRAVVNGVLKEDGHEAADLIDLHLSQIDAVQFNAPGIWIVEPAQKFQQRALPGTIDPDESGDPTGWNGQAEVRESRRGASGIAKRDTVEPNPRFQHRRSGSHLREVFERRLELEELEEVLQEQPVAVDRSDVFQERMHQTLALAEGCVEH